MAITDLPKFDGTQINLLDLLTREQILDDYRTSYRSRQASLIGRKEVMSGRAKFGAFGDGKEVPQVALAHVFNKGDWRTGYYRDQTLMMALGVIDVRSFFAQLYAHADVNADPASAGRMMNSHFATRSLNPDGTWKDLTAQHNSAPDASPTGSQMPRLVGLAYASRLFREIEDLHQFAKLSDHGDEVAFGTIGNASTAEGMFWEAINAIGVLKAPAVISIWDDGYGISVTNEHQMLKGNLSELLKGFQREGDGPGYDVYTVHGWDYPSLVMTYHQAVENARISHVPALIHVIELTQPQGHSTSGSHERYKSEERLAWEADHDCVIRMRRWLIAEGIATANDLDALEADELEFVKQEYKAAWNAFTQPISEERAELKHIIERMMAHPAHAAEVEMLRKIGKKMFNAFVPRRRDLMEVALEVLRITRFNDSPAREDLIEWRDEHKRAFSDLYGAEVVSECDESPMLVDAVPPVYTPDAEQVNGFTILNNYFHDAFSRDPRIITFGEDVGFLGGVNQSMAGMQEKYGKLRVSDTGIREVTILGQAIGMALRGLRPIAEIQYLDYLLYALQTMSDDLATIRWRTAGGQKAPVIVRTRGHRFEGIWHSGSQMAGIIHLVRGMHVLVPRDMTRAVGFYNTLLQGDDPALVIEPLIGYRRKEGLPENLTSIQIPLGVPEILRQGTDVTLVTYGALCPIALDAAAALEDVDIDVEVIDVQSLLPFDIHGMILESLKKTSRIIFVDEDVPGGTTAYMMREVLEKQGGYHWLDSEPRTLPAKEHRPAYGTDGGYFSKPNAEDIFEAIYEMMYESNPQDYPLFYADKRNMR